MRNHIRYMRREEIDTARWNHCISHSTNGVVYAYSFYLDAMATHWDALVLDDYEAVMPLPWRKKFGIHYLYQPYFANSLGILGRNVSQEETLAFVSAIPEKFILWDLDFNENNILHELPTNIKTKNRKNQFINLNLPYDQLFKSYSRLANRKIKKSSEYLSITAGIHPEHVIELYRNNYKTKDNVPLYAYENLAQLCQTGLLQGNIKTFTSSFENGDIASFYLLIYDQNFVYSLLGGSTEKGKEIGAFYFVTDHALKEFCNSEKIFRFEGSDIPGIEFFNSQFGAYLVSYCHLSKNNLRWPTSLLKNINDKIKRRNFYFT